MRACRRTGTDVDSDSAFPCCFETCKSSLEMNLNIDRFLPYVNPHLPVLSETTTGAREDEYGNEEFIFPIPNSRPPPFRTTDTLKTPAKVDEPDIVADK